jgi:hypothetical protein
MTSMMERMPTARAGPERRPEIACGSKEFDPPFPFPPGASRGGECSPHAGGTLRASKKALARIDAAGSPHKRGKPPLCIPPCVPDGFGRSVTKGKTTGHGLNGL